MVEVRAILICLVGPGSQRVESHIQDDYTGLSGILQANYAGLLPPQIWLGYPHISNIDWDSSEREYQRLSPGQRLASFKLQNGMWPTNKILHQRKQIPSPLCSRCNLYPETHNHVLCRELAQPIRLQQWNTVTTVIKTTLNTPTSLYEALEFGIRSWQEGESNIH